jgi:class 3 adenylate cyclase/tetratricopeptide (TPR) repeat protein
MWVSTLPDVSACPKCGEDNPDNAKFCLNCGSGLAPRPEAHEERKLISVLFVDLVGFTSRSDNADPEDVRDTLQLYHGRVKEQIERYGGTVEKFIGDAVMAVFGAPVAHGDDAERAARAGLRVLEAIGELNREQPGLALSARAAVVTGEAVVGVGSAPELGEAIAMGDVVNTASRLQTAAPPGGLIVGEETYRATRHAIRYEQLAAVVAKGKRHPVPAWLAVTPIGAPAERPGTGAPMVGRDREMALLKSIWERAVTERRPHLVTVFGPPGIGKSRLAREISSLIGDQGGQAVRGRCYPYETRAAYAAFGQQVKQVAGVFDQDPPEAAREKLAQAVADLLPEQEAPEVTRYLSLLLGLGVDEPVDERILLFFAAKRFVEQLGLRRSTLFVFEDIHWADSGELDLLEYLASHVRDTSAVLLGLARPELLDLRATWGSGLAAQTTIILEPLSPADASAIAAHALAGGKPSSSAVTRLVEIAEGNPLFIEELTASLLEGFERQGELPTSVKAATASRLDALPQQPRAVLLDASVIGKTFWRAALSAIRGGEAIDEALDALEAKDLIRRQATSQVFGDVEFTFKHILVRDAAYATLPRGVRRERHAAIARYLEQGGPDRARELAWLLAHHWREAGEPGKAIEYLLLAAERARQAWATDEVKALYASALELAEDEQLCTSIRLRRGLALVKLEEFEEAATDLGELIPQLEGADRLEALLARSRATLWTERPEETLMVAQEAMELAHELDAREFLGPINGRLSQAYASRGSEGDLDRALELGERALEVWVPGTRPVELAEHDALQGLAHYWTGGYQRALELSRAARQNAVDPSSAEALIRGSGSESLALTAMGRYEEALELFEQKIALGRQLGRPVRVILNYSTMPLRELYDLAEARRRTEEALEQSGWSGFNMPRLNSLVDLVFTDLAARDIGKAEARWPVVWDDVRQGKSWQGWLLAGKMMVARAEIALHTEGPEVAMEWAQKAVDLARSVHRGKYQAAARAIIGRALVDLRRGSDGVAELRTAVAEADGLGSPTGRWQMRAALARALFAVGDDDGAERVFREASQVIRDVAAGLSAARAERFLTAAPVVEVLKAAP